MKKTFKIVRVLIELVMIAYSFSLINGDFSALNQMPLMVKVLPLILMIVAYMTIDVFEQKR